MPYAQDLIVFPLNDFLRDDPLLGTIQALPQRGCQLIDDGVSDVEIVLRRLRGHVLIGTLVEAHGVPGLEPPSGAVPFALGIKAKVGRIIVLGGLQLDVEVPLQMGDLALGGSRLGYGDGG